MDPSQNISGARSVLLLNSSHGRFTVGSSPWVRATMDALDALNPDQDILLTSIGLPGWELPAYRAAQMGFRQKLILPGHDNGAGAHYYQRWQDNLGLNASLTEPIFTATGNSKEFNSVRDSLAFELADIVYPVSLRPGGRLDTLLGRHIARGGLATDLYRVEYTNNNWVPRYKLDKANLNSGLNAFDSGWLTHWTHSYPGPWPNETSADFYHDMLTGPDRYVRCARSTITRILAEGVVRGSDAHMADSETTVSLTSLPPLKALAAMCWRSRWRRWNMEPFGITVRREALVSLGARQVSYYDKLPPQLSDSEKIFSQRRGKSTDWSTEQEWRIHGDLRLDDIDPDKIALLMYENHWASSAPKRAGLYRAVAITGQNS
jgi:hypothetical protein